MSWASGYRSILQYIGILSLLALLITPIIVSILVIRIPTDYFIHGRGRFEEQSKSFHPFIRTILLAAKNLAGILFLLAGIVMLVLPGQGIITILIGLTLINFPGKRELELKIIARKRVFSAINWMRAKAHTPPLQLPEGMTVNK